MAGSDAGEGAVCVPVMRPRLPDAERLLPYLRRIDQARIYSNHGPLSTELGQRLAGMLGLPEGGMVCTGSGTAALVAAILASAGRATPARPLAVVPAYTFVATAMAVEQCGYCVHIADVDADSWTLDPERLEHHPELGRIGLVVPVAPFGRPVSLQPWQDFAGRTGIPVVIDGAASIECVAKAPELYLGTLPVTFSFHATKSFATGEGGAVATADLALAERIERALNFGFLNSRDALSASFNGKMSEYHAAVGLAELDDWPAKAMAWRAAAELYRGNLRGTALAERFYGPPDIAGCYALFECSGAEEAARISRSLERHGVDFRLWYGEGLHRQSYFAAAPRDPLHATEDLAPRLLGLPTAPDFGETDARRVVDALVYANSF